MNVRVLVAHATKYGAAAGIAEKIGAVLREAGLGVDVLPVDRVGDLTPVRGSGAGQRRVHRPVAQGSGRLLEGQREGPR